MADFNTAIIEEFRANKGKVSGMFGGMNLLLLNTKGAKTGKQTTVPVAYSKDGDKYVVVASKGGAPTNPAWYHNLLAYPEVTIEVGDKTIKVKAINVTGSERERLYAQHASAYPAFLEYKAKTTRVIPVFLLEPIQ